jgi:hypothetical protein
MRCTAASLVTVAAVLAACLAWAEPAVTIKAVDLKAQAASDAKTVASLPANTTVDLVDRQGAWVQLRSGNDVGWGKLFDVRLAGANTGPAKGGGANSLGQVLGLASGQRGASVTTGVRGLDGDTLAKATPNPQEFAKLVTFQASKEQAQTFAAAANLTPREVELLK